MPFIRPCSSRRAVIVNSSERREPSLRNPGTARTSPCPYRLVPLAMTCRRPTRQRTRQTYPPILISTSRRDDRAHPGHARKMAAKFQAMGYQAHFYEPATGGHALGKDNEEQAIWLPAPRHRLEAGLNARHPHGAMSAGLTSSTQRMGTWSFALTTSQIAQIRWDPDDNICEAGLDVR